MKETARNTIINFVLVLMLVLPLAACTGAGDEGEDTAKDKEEEQKTVAELTENSERYDGYFTVFQDKKTGETHLLIKADQIGEEFIYWVQVSNGVVDAGFFKGAYGPYFMVSVQRHFDRIEFVAENTRLRCHRTGTKRRKRAQPDCVLPDCNHRGLASG